MSCCQAGRTFLSVLLLSLAKLPSIHTFSIFLSAYSTIISFASSTCYKDPSAVLQSLHNFGGRCFTCCQASS
jgi:hypothetical protein